MVNLNQEQKEVVEYRGCKPLSVEAGPGSGKTRVIIERVKFLLKTCKIKPESLLIITFTKKAAEELQERLYEENIEKTEIEKMQISTIHSFCSKLLEENGKFGFNIIDDDIGEKINIFIEKHLRELGFTDEYYIPKRDVKYIADKYNEYTTFNVDTEKLTEYIKENYPITKEYRDYIKEYIGENKKFPEQDIRENHPEFKDIWYNAKYYQIAKSYKRYLQILYEENVSDFAQLQVDALEFLEKNPKTQYKNILIDEFQDTDPVQMKIFEILMMQAETFLVVGDMEQSIYGFRGSNENYFKQLYESKTEIEKKTLNTNYRSTNEIIDFSEQYIENQKKEHTNKKAIGARDKSQPVYYIENEKKEDEASEIANIIKELKSTGKIENYNEIGILTRSINKSGNCIQSLISILDEENIPYAIKGLGDFYNKDEIKSTLTLLYYLIQDRNPHNHIMSGWEREWLNLKAYTGENFNQVLFNLSEDTKEKLKQLEEEFEEEVIKAEKEINPKSRIKKFQGVLKRDEDTLIEIFKKVEKPILSYENLKNKYNITNQNDLELFYKLDTLREEINTEDCKLTSLDVYMKVLTEVTGYLNPDFIENKENKDIIENLASLSNSFANYEQLQGKYDFKGAFWFLYHNIKNYTSNQNPEDAVQIMTVHKAKGLEFPIVIIASLKEDDFPAKLKDKQKEKRYINGKPTYYTPIEYARYINYTDEEKIHDEEEERIIYVAITRAEDILILSGLKQMPEKIKNLIEKNKYCKRLENTKEIEKINTKVKSEDREKLKLSYTHLSNYINCPLLYKLSNKIHLKISKSEIIDEGILVHKAFEIINKKIKENKTLVDEKTIKDITKKLYYQSNINIENETYQETLKRLTENILDFYKNNLKDIEILESEYDFFLKTENYDLIGTIDLIYKNKNTGEVGIIDYKNTETDFENMKEKYERQLYTYLNALKESSPKYRDVEFRQLGIYATKLKKLYIIPIDRKKQIQIKEELEEVSDKIIEEKYPENRTYHCKYCEYKQICGEY